MKKKYSLLCIGIMLVSKPLFGQNLLDPEVWKDYNPSTPEVGKLIDHKDIPIDYTRGMANISIPLYVIETGGMSIPITLNYNHKGIKPTDQTLMLGLGWSLKAEPKIARETNGQPDSKMSYRTYSHSDAQSKIHQNYMGRNVGLDGCPDQYYYSLPNKSGSYMFLPQNTGGTLQAVTIPYEPIQITCDGNTNLINITDIDGTRYHFGGNGATESSAITPSVWKATKIVCPNRKDSVLFSYGRSGRENMPQLNDVFSIIYDPLHSRQELRISNHEDNHGIQLYSVIQDPAATPPMLRLQIKHVQNSPTLGYTTSVQYQEKKHLTSIKYGHGEVSFSYSTSSLSLIQVRDNMGKSKRNIYLYQHTPYRDENYVMLDSVVIKDEAGVTMSSYRMEYNTPPRMRGCEKSINFWGYFTGQGSGSRNRIPLLNETPVKILGPYGSLFGKPEILIPGINMETGAYSEGILRSITSHWGETIEFSYENDKYIKWNRDGSTTPMYNTGGLRIKSIDYTDPVLEENIKRVFKYGHYSEETKAEDGYGIVRRSIIPDCYMYEQEIENVFSDHRGFDKMQTYTSNLSGNWTFSGNPVVYDEVAEYTVMTKNDVEVSNGKTVYYFNYPLDSLRRWNAADTVQWIAGTNIVFDPKDDWRYGQLIRKELYNERSPLVKTEWKYQQFGNPQISTVPCWMIYKNKIYQKEYTNPDGFENDLRLNYYNPYAVWNYYIISGHMKLISEKEYHFDRYTTIEDFFVLKTNTYSYNKNGFPTTERTEYSDGSSTVTKKTTYVEDDTQTSDPLHTLAREQLLREGNIAAVMKQEITAGASKQTNQSRYKIHENGLPLPYCRITQRDKNEAEERAAIYEYDNYGNPLYTTKDGTNRTVYIWGYRGRFPVAIIRDVDYGQVSSALGGKSYFNQMAEKQEPTDVDWQRMAQLRTLLSKGHVTIFCYDPFTGCMRWELNPRGIKTYYDYDGEGRLTRTYYKEKDAQGVERECVLKTHEYHYRGF